MKIENSRYLLLACAGMIALGNDGYDHMDTEISNLASRIKSAGFPYVLAERWFS